MIQVNNSLQEQEANHWTAEKLIPQSVAIGDLFGKIQTPDEIERFGCVALIFIPACP